MEGLPVRSVATSGKEEAFSPKKGEAEAGTKKEAKVISPEVLAKASAVKSHIDSIVYSGVMGTFLKDSSIIFQVGRPGSGFYFLASGTINLDPLWFLERDQPKEIVEWAMYHEGRHANDRREDREAFDKKVDICIEKADLFLPQILAKWEKVLDMNDDKQKAFYESLSKKVPVDDGTGRKLFAPRAVYGLFKTYFSTLFNSLDDVWVNHGIYEHFPNFHPSANGGELVRKLYREVLFQGNDYTKDLKSFQYAHFLLRKSMLPGEEVTVSEEVKERLGRSHKVYGKSYSSRLELLEGRIMPSPSVDTRSRARNKLIGESFMKDFDELIALDVQNWKPEYKEEKAGSGKGQGGERAGDQNNTSPFDAPSQNEAMGSIDQLPQGEQGKIDSFIQGKEGAKNEGKRRSALSPEERAKEDKERRDIARLRKAAGAKAGNPEEQERIFLTLQKNKEIYERYLHKVESHLRELSLVWKDIIGKGIEYKKTRHRFQRKGELNIETLTPKWQAITSGTDASTSPTVFDRNFKEAREHIIPEEVRVYFLPDISGSMDEAEKLEALKTTTVLLLESFRDLQSLALASSDGENGEEDERVCQVKTKVIAFNESAHIVKDNKGVVSFEDVEGVPSALVPSGGTLSSVAYQEVLRDISSLPGEKLADGRIKVIVIELTDGATGEKEKSKDLLFQIKRMTNAVTAGILIQESNIEGEGGVERDRIQKINLETLRFVHGEGAVAEKIGGIAKRLKVIIEKAFEDVLI